MEFITPAPAEEATRAAIWPAFMSARSERGSTLLDGNERTLGRAHIDLTGTGDLLLGIQKHLLPLRDPARRARNGEEDGEGGRRHPDRLVDESRVEVHVGIELALDEVVVLQGDPLELQRDIEQRVSSRDLEHLVGDLLDDARARVVVLVDAVAEAHQALFALALLDLLDERGHALLRADLH